MAARLPSWLVLLTLGFVSSTLDGGTVAGPYFWWGMIGWLVLVVLGTAGLLFMQRWGEYENKPGRRRVDREPRPSRMQPPPGGSAVRRPPPLQAVVRWDSDTSNPDRGS